MSLDDAFFADIVEHPDDDTPRRIYADWLDEQDDSDARLLSEFIRVQLALESPPEEGPELWNLRRRQDELLQYGRTAWLGGLRELVLSETFRRGFVHTVTMEPGKFLTHADQLFALAPIQGLRLAVPFSHHGNETIANDLLASVLCSPYLRQIRHLYLDLPVSEEGVRALAELPHLTALQELEIGSPQLPADLRRLLDSARCESLQALGLSGQITAGLLAGITDSSVLPRLRSLRLNCIGDLDEQQTIRLLTSPRLDGLRNLNCGSFGSLTREIMQALRRAPCLPVLEKLHIRLFSGACVSALFDHINAPQLRLLQLRLAGLRQSDFEALADCSGLPNLTELDLCNNIGGGAGLAALARSSHLAQLAVLRLHFNGIDDEGVMALTDTGRLRDLVWLDLTANRITDFGAWAILDLLDLGRLRRLDLARNAISPENRQAMTERFGQIVRF